MRKKISRVINHPLISGSAIVFGGTMFANVLHFAFNLFMSRTLSVSEYGTLASLISVILLFALIADSFIPTVVHFSSLYFVKKEFGIVSSIFFQVSRFSFFIGIFIVGLFLFFQGFISDFFKINNTSLILLLSLTIFLAFFYSVNRAMIQSMLSFKLLSVLGILGAFIKVALGISFVKMGFGVFGAMWAFIISFFIPYIVSFIPLKFVFANRKNSSGINFNTLMRYGGPATLSILGLTFFITSDIILVKHFFSAKDAGIYAGLSLIGKVIYFFSAPIGLVMFPLIVQRYAKKENYKNIFFLSIALVLFASLSITAFYYFFPEFVIKLFLKREEYLIIKQILWIFGLNISLYSVASIATNFFLSTKKTKIFMPIIFISIIQIVLISLIHNSFLHVILISIFCMAALLLSYGIYYYMIYGKNKK
ncbi:MAG: oligosaccharide flippase family protein [Candidatus Levybacteria bacterium]|nr:oligosaccharide flippase family protein [Candidatus Levybacteria bacterium]